ncbi:hypothetical protein BaRGS_00025572 [Batillaria attramentaria]|uniref:Uncharacterized protein n=1 Tax=Batillaria attramentaria TaxID=370345 RepID=A0ABD0K7K3_9CAEN
MIGLASLQQTAERLESISLTDQHQAETVQVIHPFTYRIRVSNLENRPEDREAPQRFRGTMPHDELSQSTGNNEED